MGNGFVRMDLLPTEIREEIRKEIPALYATERVKDPVAHVKLFSPNGPFTWYVLEAGDDGDGGTLLFTFVHNASEPHFSELGYTSLEELESIGSVGGGRIVLPIERDEHYKPRPLSEVKTEAGV